MYSRKLDSKVILCSVWETSHIQLGLKDSYTSTLATRTTVISEQEKCAACDSKYAVTQSDVVAYGYKLCFCHNNQLVMEVIVCVKVPSLSRTRGCLNLLVDMLTRETLSIVYHQLCFSRQNLYNTRLKPSETNPSLIHKSMVLSFFRQPTLLHYI